MKFAMKNKSILLINILFASIMGCNNSPENNSITARPLILKSTKFPDMKAFEAIVDGKQTDLFILKNHNGMRVAITNYGGRLVSLLVPDKNGRLINVVIGLKSLENYEKSNQPYFGAIIGRYANRIAKGKFFLNGKRYTLYTNEGTNTKHGGKKGFQAVVWNANQPNDSTLVLKYLSKDMEEGFPGNLNVKVTYSITNNNSFKCEYEATTDKETVVNLTNHAFFNLNGEGSGTVLNHIVQIYANKYIPVDTVLIPLGKFDSVIGTPFDFTKPIAIGERIEVNNEQLKNCNGYDHNFVLNKTKVKGLNHAAIVIGNKSGIVMNIYTSEPGLQFYTGNSLQGKNSIGNGGKDDFRTAFAMETQHFPNSPNEPSFPSTVLKPLDKYRTTSIYSFSISR